jgi:hypothetical protein
MEPVKTIVKKELSGESSVPMVAQSIEVVNVQGLLTQAIEKNLSVETMERLLAMAEKMQAIHAKKEFDRSMSSFQSECPVIQKRKKVAFGTTNYSYAPLDDIVDQVKDILSRNGFSYTFDTEQSETMMRVFCIAKHELGHTERSKFEIQIDTAAKMNKSQQYGAALTYAKRYAFCNAFGILTGDEDTDAQTPAPQEEVYENRPVITAYHKITPKQKEFAKKLATEKGIDTAELTALAKKYSASDLIEYLLGVPIQSPQQELPVIQEEETIDVSKIPF